MIRSLRKGSSFIDVAYQNGGYSTLHAEDFTLEASAERVVLSVDLSPNERTRNKDSNCYHDVMELIEQLSQVRSFEITKEKWLVPLAKALNENRSALRELKIRFKDGSSHTYQYIPQNSDLHLILNVVKNGQQA